MNIFLLEVLVIVLKNEESNYVNSMVFTVYIWCSRFWISNLYSMFHRPVDVYALRIMSGDPWCRYTSWNQFIEPPEYPFISVKVNLTACKESKDSKDDTKDGKDDASLVSKFKKFMWIVAWAITHINLCECTNYYFHLFQNITSRRILTISITRRWKGTVIFGTR